MALVITKRCLRFATQPAEGFGWSFYRGDDWPLPKQSYGCQLVTDSNGVPRLIAIDRNDGYAYELGTCDRISSIRPAATDKAGTEISSERWAGDLTAGPGSEYAEMTHEVSHAWIAPEQESNRGKDGYSASGQRDAQSLSMETYANGARVTPDAYVSSFPENGDVVFPGIRSRARRHQPVFKAAAGELRVTGMRHQYSVENVKGSRAERTMGNGSALDEFVQNRVMFLGRANTRPLRDRVSGSDLTASYTRTTGPDGRANSALVLTSDMVLGDIAAGDATIMFWTTAGLTDAPITGYNVELFQYGDAVGDWKLYCVTIMGSPEWSDVTVVSGTTIYCPGVWAAQLSNACRLAYYNDVVRNQGRAFLGWG
jgi:hypothetical protein